MAKSIAVALRIICCACLTLLLIRILFGPVAGMISARSTLNIAAFAFLSLLAAILSGVRSPNEDLLASARPSIPPWVFVVLLSVFATAPFLPNLNAPFLFDDFVHLSATNTIQRMFFEHPQGGDGFFRPLGLLYFRFTAQWAEWNPILWHASGLAIHAANTVLVYFLLKRMGGSAWPALGGAVLFACHASHVEPVCWTAASFDLLAAFFSLVTLLLIAYSRNTAVLMFTGALACLSKESAYCLPLLAACMALFYQGQARRNMWRKAVGLAVACTLVFGYRLWYLQGIGGYKTTSGSPMVFSSSMVSAAQAFLLRLWALLFLPVNWSISQEWWLRVAAVLMLISIAVFVWNSRRVAVRPLAAALLFTLCAAIPVFPLLLIGSDLGGARVLYLPSIGLALLGSVIVAKGGARYLVFVLLFQIGALLHNEAIWKNEAKLAGKACTDVAAILKQDQTAHIYTVGLPRTRHGVFFLGNGFAECVDQAGGHQVNAASRISANPPSSLRANDHVATWDAQKAELVITKPD